MRNTFPTAPASPENQMPTHPHTTERPLPGLVSVLQHVCVRFGEVFEGRTRTETFQYNDAYLPIIGTRDVVYDGEVPVGTKAEMILPNGQRLGFEEDLRGDMNPTAGAYRFELSFTERMKAEWFRLRDSESR